MLLTILSVSSPSSLQSNLLLTLLDHTFLSLQVLKGMAVETKVVQPMPTAGSSSGPPTKRAPPPPPVPLSLPQLELAIALVQRISDEVMQVRILNQ